MLARYFLYTFLWVFMLSLIILTLIFQTADFFAVLWPFITNYSFNLPSLWRLSFYNLPQSLYTALPFAQFFALVYTADRFMQSRELTAAYTLGFSPLRIFAPWLLLAVFLGGFRFALMQYGVIPFNTERAALTANVDNGRNIANMSWHADNFFFTAASYNAYSRIFRDITIVEFDAGYQLRRRIDADRAVWDDDKGRLTLYDVRIIDMGVEPSASFEPILIYGQAVDPDLMLRISTDRSLLTLGQLQETIALYKSTGVNYAGVTLEYQRRVLAAAAPLVIGLMVFVIAGSGRLYSFRPNFVLALVFIVMFYGAAAAAGSLYTARIIDGSTAFCLPYMAFSVIMIMYYVGRKNLTAKILRKKGVGS
jgi:lipopolysaccharide export LptBFGC system permease protein LptF